MCSLLCQYASVKTEEQNKGKNAPGAVTGQVLYNRILLLITEVKKNQISQSFRGWCMFSPQGFTTHVLVTGMPEKNLQEKKSEKLRVLFLRKGERHHRCNPASQKAAQTGNLLYVRSIQHDQVRVTGWVIWLKQKCFCIFRHLHCCVSVERRKKKIENERRCPSY